MNNDMVKYHGKHCSCCGKVMDVLAGNPSMWPMPMWLSGGILAFCMGCVQSAMIEYLKVQRG